MRGGIIDVGTNSVRVLVADLDGEQLREYARELTITRLGEGVDRTRALSAEPLRRTIDAIGTYADLCARENTERVQIIATSAVRDATNRDAFFEAVRARTGLDATLLTGEQEAHLGFAGATYGISGDGPFLVVDIGGGSTEFVRGTTKAEAFISLDIGSVRLTERHIKDDPPNHDGCEALRQDAAVQIARAAAAVGTDDATMIGLAGTITTVAAIALGLRGYDREKIHASVLRLADVQRVRARLVSMTSTQRRALPAMPSGREDVIVGGVLILEEVMARFRAPECTVSETDILDGTMLSLLQI